MNQAVKSVVASAIVAVVIFFGASPVGAQKELDSSTVDCVSDIYVTTEILPECQDVMQSATDNTINSQIVHFWDEPVIRILGGFLVIVAIIMWCYGADRRETRGDRFMKEMKDWNGTYPPVRSIAGCPLDPARHLIEQEPTGITFIDSPRVHDLPSAS